MNLYYVISVDLDNPARLCNQESRKSDGANLPVGCTNLNRSWDFERQCKGSGSTHPVSGMRQDILVFNGNSTSVESLKLGKSRFELFTKPMKPTTSAIIWILFCYSLSKVLTYKYNLLLLHRRIIKK